MKIRKRRPLSNTGGLVGPDVADTAEPPIEVVGNTVNAWAFQFVNRWVFLHHQRAAALEELKQLIEEARRET